MASLSARSEPIPPILAPNHPEFEHVLTHTIRDFRRPTFIGKKVIGKHQIFEFSVTFFIIQSGGALKMGFSLDCKNEAQEAKQREWRLPLRYALEYDGSVLKSSLVLSDSNDGDFIGYAELKGDSLEFTIRVWVPECLKEFKDPKYSDSSIVVDGEEFLVSKLFISSQSPVLETSFKWAAEQGKEPKINVDLFYPYEMQNFLELIHGEPVIRDDNIISLFELAHYFGSQTALRRCLDFLMNTSKLGIKERFDLAEKFSMPDYRKHVIKTAKSGEELKLLLPEDRSQINHEDLLDFFNTSMNLLEKHEALATPAPPKPPQSNAQGCGRCDGCQRAGIQRAVPDAPRAVPNRQQRAAANAPRAVPTSQRPRFGPTPRSVDGDEPPHYYDVPDFRVNNDHPDQHAGSAPPMLENREDFRVYNYGFVVQAERQEHPPGLRLPEPQQNDEERLEAQRQRRQ